MNSGHDTGRFAQAGDLAQVSSHAEAAQVVRAMVADLRAHPAEWENPTLERFLHALARTLRDLPGLYGNRGEPLPEPPTWKLFTEALVMATGHE